MTETADRTRKPGILLVDDTPDNIALLAALLKDRYTLKIAGSGAKALQIAASSPRPDLILLDVMMPGMDGLETCRRLKADPDTKAIPVIFLTSRARQEDRDAGLLQGAADYITKPIDPHDVLARVAAHIACRSVEGEKDEEGEAGRGTPSTAA